MPENLYGYERYVVRMDF